MPSETTGIAFCDPQQKFKAPAGSSALMLQGRKPKEEDEVKALSEGKRCELPHDKS